MILLNKVEKQPIEFLEKTDDNILNKARRAAKAHKIIRSNLYDMITPGMNLTEIVERTTEWTRILLKGELNDGIGFPTGISVNECAAHYSINPKDKDIILKPTDVLKIDYGTHVDGLIMDSAFTITFDEEKRNLLMASKEGTATSIKNLGVDARVCEIGAMVNEVMSSYSCTFNGKSHKILPVANLNGHSIEPFKIHAGISIPMINNGDKTKFTPNTFYAVETFASTGQGFVNEFGNCSHYMVNNLSRANIRNPKTIKVFEAIKTHIGTLPFAPYMIDHYVGFNSYPFIKMLAYQGVLDPYPPLVDSANSFVSQFEHTLFLTETSKEILTVGDDY